MRRPPRPFSLALGERNPRFRAFPWVGCGTRVLPQAKCPQFPGGSNTRKCGVMNSLIQIPGFDSPLAPQTLYGSNTLLLWLKRVHVFEQGLRAA